MTDEQEQELKRRWLVWRLVLQYGIGVVVLVFFVIASLHFRYTPDDTYIYLQYGRNIARGEGFSFNAGTPSYGVTGPLWALMIAAGAKLSLDPYIVAKTLDIVFASFSVIGVLAFAFILMRDRIFAVIAAWIFSFDAWLLRWSGTGLETSLALLLVMLTLWYAYKKEYMTAAFVAGLLTLVRPEGTLLFLAVLADCGFNCRVRAAVGKTILASTMIFILVAGPWLLYAYSQFGTIIPNTFRVHSTDVVSAASVWHSLMLGLQVIGMTELLMSLCVVAGIIIALRRFGWRGIREDVFPLFWMVLLPLFYVVTNVQIVSRYLVLSLPVIVVYGVWGIKRLEIASIVTPQRGLVILLTIAALSLAQNQYIYQRWFAPHMGAFELGAEDCLKPIAYWIRSNAPAGSTVLTPAVGMLGYISERSIIDAQGVVTTDAKRAFAGGEYDRAMAGRRYETVVHPDYILDRSSTPGRFVSDSLRPVMTRSFSGFGLSDPGLEYFTLYKVMR